MRSFRCYAVAAAIALLISGTMGACSSDSGGGPGAAGQAGAATGSGGAAGSIVDAASDPGEAGGRDGASGTDAGNCWPACEADQVCQECRAEDGSVFACVSMGSSC